MKYAHQWLIDNEIHAATSVHPGKVVCVGRNYAEHAAELGNEVPKEPLFFIKPATAMVPFAPNIQIPTQWGSCHHELEIALLITQPLTRCQDASAALAAIGGIGLGLDLTLRDVQSQLKAQGHPWERAKAFDGSCPLTPFVPVADVAPNWEALGLTLHNNGELRQQGTSAQMLFPIAELLNAMSQLFSLMPGDVVMTGTPAGVGSLQVGDQLEATLQIAPQQSYRFNTFVSDTHS